LRRRDEIGGREHVKGPASRNQDFCNQIQKSSAKAPAQIAEGFLRFRPKESAYYYRVARRLEKQETHLRRGLKRKYWSEEVPEKMWEVSDVALKTTTGLLNSRLEKIRQEEAEKRRNRRQPASWRVAPRRGR